MPLTDVLKVPSVELISVLKSCALRLSTPPEIFRSYVPVIRPKSIDPLMPLYVCNKPIGFWALL